MTKADIRWQQRFANYRKALQQLREAVLLVAERPLSQLEKQGLIQAFEFTHELAWKTLKDFFVFQGNQEIYGSRDAAREAFSLGMVEDGEVWMDMIASRNKTSHTYNQAVAEEIIEAILQRYMREFESLEGRLVLIEGRPEKP